MVPVTRQDVQSITDASRNRILQQLAQRQDMLGMVEMLRNVLNNQQQLINMQQQSILNQQQVLQMLRQAETQALQMNRRATALDTRISQLEQEVRSHKGVVNRLADQKVQPQTVRVQMQPDQNGQVPDQRYVFSTN